MKSVDMWAHNFSDYCAKMHEFRQQFICATIPFIAANILFSEFRLVDGISIWISSYIPESDITWYQVGEYIILENIVAANFQGRLCLDEKRVAKLKTIDEVVELFRKEVFFREKENVYV